MTFLCSLLVMLVLCWFFSDFVRKHTRIFYGIALGIALCLILGTFGSVTDHLSDGLLHLLWDPFAKGSLATALFVLVMYAGALKNGSPLQKKLMPIRGELSIAASILTLGHNLSAGQEYFPLLFQNHEAMPLNIRLATLSSIFMMLIMIPLFVTSFRSIRKKMKPAAWKKLQRGAYAFYALIYIHVLLLYVPMTQAGDQDAQLNLLLFTAVFFVYFAMRLRKALEGKKLRKVIPVVCILSALMILGMSTEPPKPSEPLKFDQPATPTYSEHIKAENPEALPTLKGKKNHKDGVYEGEGRGYSREPVVLSVTLKDNRIVALDIVSHDEDQPYWNRCLVTMERILDEQKTKVDTVGGATKSCKGIQKAVEDALKQAE